MKLWGSILIIFSCSLFGFFKAYSLRLRCRSLLEIKSVLESLKAEIAFLKHDLKDAFLTASKSLSVYPLFSDCANDLKVLGIDEAWAKSLKKNAPLLFLSAEDTEVLKNFSKELGKTDIANQIRHLDFFSELLGTLYANANTEYKQKSSVYKSLGTAIGIFAVLLLI